MNQSSNPSAKKILLVENSNTARLIIARDLNKHGHELQSVATGKEAVALLQKESFDVIVMDVFLPEMNGYEATQEIRKMNSKLAKTPIIAYTASKNEFDKKLCLESGMTEFVNKSEDNQSLVDAIARY